MRIVKHIFHNLALLAAMLFMVACSEEVTPKGEPLPEGMGRIRITLQTPDKTTRAVNEPNDGPGHEFPWETPDHDWEKLQTFRIFICDASNKIVQIIEGDKDDLTPVEGTQDTYPYKQSAEILSGPLPEGTYYIYATANYADGYNVDDEINLERTEKFPFGLSETGGNYSNTEDYPNGIPFGAQRDIPMTGKLIKDDGSIKPVGVSNGTTVDAGIIRVWRVMAKLQFKFVNESTEKIKILGIEMDPINLASSSGPGVYLFSKDKLESVADLAPGATPPTGQEGITLPTSARNDMGPVRYEPTTPLQLDAKNDGDSDEGNIFFYINESDATFTTTDNQYSLRFKIAREKSAGEWYADEFRYGVTTHHDLSNSGPYGGTNGGFNVIRRNDWIHIPVTLTDWQLRIEPIAFVPIAGYPAKTVSSDGLTATFSTGGIIALQPFVKKYSDATWRDFSDPEITYGMGREVKENDVVDVDASWVASIHWKNNDGDTQSGDGKIVKKPFTYDATSHCIIGELNQALVGHNYMTTFTIEVTLGPKSDSTKQYGYSFTFNVVLQ